MAVVTLFAIVPLVEYVFPYLQIGARYINLPNWLNPWVEGLGLVVIMTYIVMPLMTRLFSKWLYKNTET
ncbi:MAG: hypothetical protein N2D54_02140 [Chloroflexota bacterium]